LIVCSGCTIGSAESAIHIDNSFNESVSSDVYPLSRSVLGDVYGQRGSAKRIAPAPLKDVQRPPLRNKNG
jgi:hypothetical protein